MSEISKEIGQNIRRTRKMRKITHQQLAQAIGKASPLYQNMNQVK